jgi:DNA polymerase III sliding clamp (beta) subunit (PCNA family)
VTTDDSRGVDLIFKERELAFKVASSATGQADTALDIQYQGPEVVVTLDPRYVLDSLTALGKADLTMRLIDGRAAFGIETEDGFNSVVMPLTRDR